MNKNKSLPFIIGGIVIVITLRIVFVQNSNSQSAVAPSTTTTTDTVMQGYTLADVATHSTSSDCWTAVNGSVYNVTSWIAQHPGGAQAITGMCGVDGSSAYDGQHGTARRPASELASFKIGTLK